MKDKDTIMLEEAYTKVLKEDMGDDMYEMMMNNLEFTKFIAQDQDIESDINWSKQGQATWEVYDLVFRGMLKDGLESEVEDMWDSYVEAFNNLED